MAGITPSATGAPPALAGRRLLMHFKDLKQAFGSLSGFCYLPDSG
jgi:hypothetical protein